MRKPVAVFWDQDFGRVVICDDGAVFHVHGVVGGVKYQEEAPIPGTARARDFHMVDEHGTHRPEFLQGIGAES